MTFTSHIEEQHEQLVTLQLFSFIYLKRWTPPAHRTLDDAMLWMLCTMVMLWMGIGVVMMLRYGTPRYASVVVAFIGLVLSARKI